MRLELVVAAPTSLGADRSHAVADGEAMHDTGLYIVADCKMLRAAIVPDCEVPFTPTMPTSNVGVRRDGCEMRNQ